MRSRFVARAGETDLGDLDQLVVVETAIRAGDGMGGGPVSGWATAGEIWASVLPLSASESERHGKARSLSVYRFRVLTEAISAIDVTPAHRLVWGGRIFDVREVRAPPPSSPFTDMIAETVG